MDIPPAAGFRRVRAPAIGTIAVIRRMTEPGSGTVAGTGVSAPDVKNQIGSGENATEPKISDAVFRAPPV